MLSPEYKHWLTQLKTKIRSTQAKAALAVNSALIHFYWDLGKMISEKEKVWGSKFLENVSKDLRLEFPEMTGFSVTNLKYCKQFYSFFSIRPQPVDQLQNLISPQAGDEINSSIHPQAGDEMQMEHFNHESAMPKHVAQIPWGHIRLIITKIKKCRRSQFLYYPNYRKRLE